MARFGAVLARKFSSEKPASGSQMFATSFGDIMQKAMPTVKPSTDPPESSKKEPNSEWIRDEKTGLYFKYFWKAGTPYPLKMLKKPPWLRLDWTIG